MHGPEDPEALGYGRGAVTEINVDSADPAAVHELESGYGSFFVDCIREPLQSGNELVMPASSLAYIALAFTSFIHVNALHKHHSAYHAPSPIPDVGYVRVRDKSIVTVEIVFCRSINNPVRDHQVADLNRLEQVRVLLRPWVFGIVPFKK
jgi:hypothetical protein